MLIGTPLEKLIPTYFILANDERLASHEPISYGLNCRKFSVESSTSLEHLSRPSYGGDVIGSAARLVELLDTLDKVKTNRKNARVYVHTCPTRGTGEEISRCGSVEHVVPYSTTPSICKAYGAGRRAQSQLYAKFKKSRSLTIQHRISLPKQCIQRLSSRS
jgi:hypothetical protein